MEFEVSDNPHDVVKLDVKGAPVIITLSQVWTHTMHVASHPSLYILIFLSDRKPLSSRC